MMSVLQTVEAVYENGLLRPLKPIQGLGNQVYLVMILKPDAEHAQERSPANHNLRGKYRGCLSSADEFARSKQVEKALER
jgi:predicted DNA-binding antitoxin AbrB/MazE fold protein